MISYRFNSICPINIFLILVLPLNPLQVDLQVEELLSVGLLSPRLHLHQQRKARELQLEI